MVLVHVQTTKYLLNIAKAISDILIENGFEIKLVDAVGVDRDIKSNKEPDYYIFLFIWQITEQPRKAKFCIYNLEQVKYFPHFPYLHKPCNDNETRLVTYAFNNAFAIYDYSKQNLLHYPKQLHNKSSYLPIPLRIKNNVDFPITNIEKEYHILFFGAISDRRKKILDFIINKTPLKIKIVENETGAYLGGLYREIKKAYIVLNIHSRKESLLETARIHDCLRMGQCIIVSEDSNIDQKTVEQYKNIVNFTPTIKNNLSNIYETLKVVKNLLNQNLEQQYQDIENNTRILNNDILNLHVNTYKNFTQ